MTLTYIVLGVSERILRNKGKCPLPTLNFLLGNLWFLGWLQFDSCLYLSICTSAYIAYKIVGFHMAFPFKDEWKPTTIKFENTEFSGCFVEGLSLLAVCWVVQHGEALSQNIWFSSWLTLLCDIKCITQSLDLSVHMLTNSMFVCLIHIYCLKC